MIRVVEDECMVLGFCMTFRVYLVIIGYLLGDYLIKLEFQNFTLKRSLKKIARFVDWLRIYIYIISKVFIEHIYSIYI